MYCRAPVKMLIPPTVNIVSQPTRTLGAHTAPLCPVEKQVLEFLDSAIEDFERGCTSYHQWVEQKRAIEYAYQQVQRFGLVDALTEKENTVCEECVQ